MLEKQTNFKSQFQNFWNVFLNRMGKLAEQKHMSALRDGFALIVPLIIAASIGVICMTFVFGWWDTVQTSILGWITIGIPGQVNSSTTPWEFIENSIAHQISTIGTFIFYTIWKGIFSFLSIFVTLTIGYSFARIKEVKDPFITSLIALGAFMILSYGDVSLFGTNGMLVAIIASLLSVELFSFFEKNKKLELKMPAGVPPAVARSFSKLFPTIFTLLIMIGLQSPFIIFSALITAKGVGDSFGLGHAISSAIQSPFLTLVSDDVNASLGIGLVYTFFVSFLWFFGIHGTNVLMAVFSPLTIYLLEHNVDIIENDLNEIPSAMADGTLDAFVFFGGVGATLAFVLVGLLLSKKKETREILKFGGPSAIFNINEPLIFGVPMILNVTYAIPFILIQPILYSITWLLIEKLQWVPGVIVKIPWTSPVGIGGFLAVASWEGIVLSLFNFTLACLMYTPFVILANKAAKKKNEELVKIDYKGSFEKLTQKISSKKNTKKGVDDEK